MEFEWDKLKAAVNFKKHKVSKAAVNFKKHKVSFDEASTVFDDPLARIFDDPEHSAGERREIIVGHSILGRILLVCFMEREEDVVRVFSARLASRKERLDYEENAGR